MPHVISIDEIHNYSERGVSTLLLLLHPAIGKQIDLIDEVLRDKDCPAISFPLIDLQCAVLH